MGAGVLLAVTSCFVGVFGTSVLGVVVFAAFSIFLFGEV